jgi:hypothetical protein
MLSLSIFTEPVSRVKVWAVTLSSASSGIR